MKSHSHISIWQELTLTIKTMKIEYLNRQVKLIRTCFHSNYDGNKQEEKLSFLFMNWQVENVFTLPLSYLLDPKNQGHTRFRWQMQMPVFVNSHRNVWGLTSMITNVFLKALFPESQSLETFLLLRNIEQTHTWHGNVNGNSRDTWWRKRRERGEIVLSEKKCIRTLLQCVYIWYLILIEYRFELNLRKVFW